MKQEDEFERRTAEWISFWKAKTIWLRHPALAAKMLHNFLMMTYGTYVHQAFVQRAVDRSPISARNEG